MLVPGGSVESHSGKNRDRLNEGRFTWFHRNNSDAQSLFIPFPEQWLFLTKRLNNAQKSYFGLVRWNGKTLPHNNMTAICHNETQPHTQIKMSRYFFQDVYNNFVGFDTQISMNGITPTGSLGPTGIHWHSEWVDWLSPHSPCSDPPVLDTKHQQ